MSMLVTCPCVPAANSASSAVSAAASNPSASGVDIVHPLVGHGRAAGAGGVLEHPATHAPTSTAIVTVCIS